MSMESLRRGGYLSVKTDGDKSEIEVVGTAYDLVFNLVLMTMAVADKLNMPVSMLAKSMEENAEEVRREIKNSTHVDTGTIERMMGRGGNQES